MTVTSVSPSSAPVEPAGRDESGYDAGASDSGFASVLAGIRGDGSSSGRPTEDTKPANTTPDNAKPADSDASDGTTATGDATGAANADETKPSSTVGKPAPGDPAKAAGPAQQADAVTSALLAALAATAAKDPTIAAVPAPTADTAIGTTATGTTATGTTATLAATDTKAVTGAPEVVPTVTPLPAAALPPVDANATASAADAATAANAVAAAAAADRATTENTAPTTAKPAGARAQGRRRLDTASARERPARVHSGTRHDRSRHGRRHHNRRRSRRGNAQRGDRHHQRREPHRDPVEERHCGREHDGQRRGRSRRPRPVTGSAHRGGRARRAGGRAGASARRAARRGDPSVATQPRRQRTRFASRCGRPSSGGSTCGSRCRDGVMHASIHAEHAQTADLVRNALDDLRAATRCRRPAFGPVDRRLARRGHVRPRRTHDHSRTGSTTTAPAPTNPVVTIAARDQVRFATRRAYLRSTR